MATKKCAPKGSILKPTDEVYYSGSYLPFLDVNTGDILTGVLVKINQALSTVPGGSYEYVKGGNATLVGDGLKLSFTFPHTLGVAPDSVVVVGSSVETSQNFHTSFNATNVTVTYTVAPGPGETLTWSYVAVKNKQ